MEMHDEMMAGSAMKIPMSRLSLGMIPHHQGAIDMARNQLRADSDPENMELARHIIAEQQREIAAMRAWLQERGVEAPDN